MGYIYYGFASEPKIVDSKVDTEKAIATSNYKSDLYPIKKIKWIATNGISGEHWSIEEV